MWRDQIPTPRSTIRRRRRKTCEEIRGRPHPDGLHEEFGGGSPAPRLARSWNINLAHGRSKRALAENGRWPTHTFFTTIAVFRLTMSLPPNVGNNERSAPQSQERKSVSMYVDAFRAFRGSNPKSTSALVVRSTPTR